MSSPPRPAEVQQAADPLRRAVRVRAALDDLALLAQRLGAAHRAVRRHLPDRLGAVAGVDDRGHDLRDDVAGPLEDDRVPDPQVLAPDLVDVVERRVADRRAADEDRRHVRDRGHRAGAPDVDLDLLELRGDLLGRELVRRRPARRAADEAELSLLRERVDLDDDPVGLVLEVLALLGPLLGVGDDLVDPSTRRTFGLTGKPRRRSRSRDSEWVVSPCAPTSWYVHRLSRRLAVTFGSFWRTVPAVVLRALA